MSRTYKELVNIPDFIGRFNYLKMEGIVGETNPEVRRWLNQQFYHSQEWRRIRNEVIIRDNGCDMGIEGRTIFGRPEVHHIEVISYEDVLNRSPKLFDLDNLILVSHKTHNAIHYGSEDQLAKDPIERTPGDTCPWK